MQHKERLDVLLVNRGLSESREKAKATIMPAWFLLTISASIRPVPN